MGKVSYSEETVEPLEVAELLGCWDQGTTGKALQR